MGGELREGSARCEIAWSGGHTLKSRSRGDSEMIGRTEYDSRCSGRSVINALSRMNRPSLYF